MKDFLLTVDSGGSKTKLSLYDENGLLIKEDCVKGYGQIVDCENLLTEFINELKDFCGLTKVCSVVCNLGGKNKNQMLKTLTAVFPTAKIILFRESEGVVGLKLCQKYNADVCLMVGTGSIAIAPVGEKVVISGGWGANISDDGSGYQLGLDAIRLALKEMDGIKEPSLLTKTITGVNILPKPMTAEEYCDFRDGVRKKLFPLERSHIASFAKVVYACAKQGDKSALELYKKVGYDLADGVLLAIKKTGKRLDGVVVTGGMVNAKEFWQNEFENKLKEINQKVKVDYITNGVEVATLQIAKESYKGE